MESTVTAGSDPIVPARRVGWIGAGKMGAPMIRNIAAQGARIAVSEPSATRRAELVTSNACEATTLQAHADSAIVFSTLPDDQALLDVVLGTAAHQGLAGIMAPGSVFVEMSTVSPACSRRVSEALGEAGVFYLRSPLSGSTTMAEQATLTVLASGDEEAWTTALPYIRALSARQFYLGERDEARYMKLVLNTLVGASAAILSEALSLGQSGGLNRAGMMEVICESAVSSPLFAYKTDTVVSDDYAPAFSVAQMIKDFTLISDEARESGVPLRTGSLILQLDRAGSSRAGLQWSIVSLW